MAITTEILQVLHYHPMSSRVEIIANLNNSPSDSTMKRLINDAVKRGLILVHGKGPATRYSLSPQAHVTMPLDLNTYFEKDIDQRQVQEHFNFELIRDILPHVTLFTEEESSRLHNAQSVFSKNLEGMSESSQIEGNTYSLLETERLLKEKKEASGKSKEEAIMLLNHKDALDFVLDTPDFMKELKVNRIEQIHSILTQELAVDRNIRQRRVGITGTNYRPLDNEFQIREALEDMCNLINLKEDIFEKSLLALVLLSYIQAFTDGNKRTARITGNAILIANGFCPISFRTVDSIDYKKAMLIFYEQNNIAAFKKIFIEQFEFAVRTYF